MPFNREIPGAEPGNQEASFTEAYNRVQVEVMHRLGVWGDEQKVMDWGDEELSKLPPSKVFEQLVNGDIPMHDMSGNVIEMSRSILLGAFRSNDEKLLDTMVAEIERNIRVYMEKPQ